MMQLVIIKRETRCVVCGRIVRAQTEARRWIGETVVHPQCASELAGPAGR
jgi:hypothetical protein